MSYNESPVEGSRSYKKKKNKKIEGKGNLNIVIME